MFFSRKKKIQRDRQAGLVFQWRGGYASNRVGMLLAIIIATTGFAIGFFGINVYITNTANPVRHRAKVTQIGEVNNDLRWLVERNSPHMAPWYAQHDEIAVDSVERKLQSLIYDGTKKLNWQSVDEGLLQYREQGSGSSDAIAVSQFPSLQRFKTAKNALHQSAKIAWEYRITTSSALAKSRLPERLNYPVLYPPLKLLGETKSFSVTLDDTGKLLSSLPLDWQAYQESRLIQNWLTSVRFKPAKKAPKNELNAKKLPQTIKLSVTLSATEPPASELP